MFRLKKTKKSEVETKPLTVGQIATINNFIGAKSIPPMPAAAQKAFLLATNPAAEVSDFVEVIESDESLSARVVKIANSVYFDRGQRKDTVEDCVTTIGLNELRCLLNATSLAELLPSRHPARPQFWSNDIATAIIARHLAERVIPGKKELAFLAGLMHDLGKLLLIQKNGEEYNKVLGLVRERGLSFIEAENELFAFNHTEVGQLIAEKWNFSPEIVSVIRNHHDPLPTRKPDPNSCPLWIVIASADLIAHALALGHLQGYAQLQNHASEQLSSVWELLDIKAEDASEELNRLRKSFETEADLYLKPGG